ncbi:hypothetical protein BaRGS_00034445, partial [Batillaria attramentaria]
VDKEGQGRISQLLSWAGPRTVVVPRSPQGFGFTLRHFVVYPPESAAKSHQGADLYSQDDGTGVYGGGPEPLDTIFVKTVREGSTAHLAGLTAGDRIVAVNGEPVSGKSYSEVIALIHSSHRNLKLLVVPRDEDILQMAYQSQSAESLSGSSASLTESGRLDAEEPAYSPMHRSAVKLSVTSPSGQRPSSQPPFQTSSPRLVGDEVVGVREEAGGRMRSTLVRDDPSVSRRSPQSRDGAGRPMSQDSALRLAGGVPSRTKYSFGLYFPPRYPSYQSRAASADNLSRSLMVQQDRQRAGSDTSSSGSLQDSNISMTSRDTDFSSRPISKTPSPRHSYAQSGVGSGIGDRDRGGRESRYYVPVLTQSTRPPENMYGVSRPTSDRPHRASVGSTVTMATQPTSDRPQRASVGSSLSRPRDSGDGAGHTTFVVRIPVSTTATASPQHSYGSSFAVTRSPRHTMIDVQRQSPSHSSHIEVSTQATPPGTHIVEVQRPGSSSRGSVDRQSSPEGPNGGGGDLSRIVLQRKVLFENGKNENNVPGKLPNRHLTELEKITRQRKFASVATRMASFEKSSDEENDEPQAREATPPQAQPGVKVRRVSLEHYPQPELEAQPSGGEMYAQGEQPVDRSVRSDQMDSPLNMAGTTGPVRIFVSPSPHSTPSPPIVEIVPVYQDSHHMPHSDARQPVCVDVHPAQPSAQPVQVVQPLVRDLNSYMTSDTGYQTVHTRPLSGHGWQQVDVDWQSHARDAEFRPVPSHLSPADTPIGTRPARKSSYLSAVNAPPSRYSLSPSPEHEDKDDGEDDTVPTLYYPHHLSQPSVMSASDSAVTFSRSDPPQASGMTTCSVDTLPSVVRRKKDAASMEDAMAKLHRRTSYLMATARDRSNNAGTVLDSSVSPYSMAIPEEPTFTPVRQLSLNKLKNFFGEQTPSIVEATERKGEAPESPLPDITREGPLWCKTAMYDGKKCSDRSWKQVWAVLRGHALFFIKDRREGTAPTFSFEEPPVSIKSCLVDIAHDYSRKRKNVFRLTTYTESVYLLQAEDKGTMMSWIQAIKTNNNPDNDDEGIGSADLIRRKASTQSDDDGGKKGWKGRIMPRSFRKHTADDGGQAGGSEPEEDISKLTFGVPLEDCFPSPNNEFVPLIVELCTRIVEVRGMEVVGVYRVPGNSVAVAHMQEELNRGIENMNMDNDKWLDVNVVSSLLKAFLRKLPHPLVTPDLYDAFIEANRNPNPEKRMLKLKRLLHTLPEHHYETFKHLAEHLSRVASNGHLNKMDAKNLAIMFGPTLIRKVDDDTASLVTDMSDQCRIVESVVLHNEWFFSNWTQDHYVPVDTHDQSHPSATDTRVARDDDEDADSAINTKEIISSIVTAANKKLKLRQQNKSTDSLDFDTTFSQSSANTTTYSERGIDIGGNSYQERNIDAAVQRSISVTKSQSSLASSLSASEEGLDRRATAPLATSEPDFLDWEERHPYAGRGRHMSDDALLERSDEVEVGGWVGQNTLDWLKRLEQEARTIRRLEEQRQRDMERRRRQQQAIERELQRSQRDLELEDAHTVEDILAWPSSKDCAPTTSAWSSAPRTTFAPLTFSESKQLNREPASDGRTLVSVAPQPASQRGGGGGKYFVSVANTRDSHLLRPASLENIVEGSSSHHVSRTGSLENVVDSPPSCEHYTGVTGHGRNLGNSGIRHGSLDSLLDLIDKREHQQGDSDSEDGSDLLTSLTTTFDQKLQILLNPKYRLTARHSRLPNSQSRSNAGATMGVSQGTDGVLVVDKNIGRGREAGFRDPSLHRAARSDPKIGIASRFEWGTSAAPGSSQSTSTPNSGARRSQLPDFRSFLSRTARPETNNGSVVLTQPKKLATAHPETQSGASAKPASSRSSSALQGRQATSRLDFRPISKSEKMEVNTALARLKKEEKDTQVKKDMRGQAQSPADCPTGADSNRKDSVQGGGAGCGDARAGVGSTPQGQQKGAGWQDEASGAERVKKDRRKRRHTLGGTCDLDHFKALLAVNGSQVDNRPRSSAWEQLRPSSNQSGVEAPPDRSLQSWLQKERLRGSTPDLLNCDFTVPSRQSAT